MLDLFVEALAVFVVELAVWVEVAASAEDLAEFLDLVEHSN